MSLKEGTDRDGGTLVEKNQHQRVTGDGGVTSRLRAANSMTASTCSRSRPSNHSIISSMLAPAFRFSKMTETGMRVPLSTQAPLTFPGMLSTTGHCDQSRAATEGFFFRTFYTFSRVSAGYQCALNNVKWVMKGGAVVADKTKGQVR